MTQATALDLTAEQIEDIEEAVGLPINRWRDDAPKGRLYPLILAAIKGDDVAKYRAMKLSQLVELVSLDSVDEGEDSPNA